MGKDKIRRFNEMSTFNNVFQPSFEEIFNKDYKLKSNWNREVFQKNQPLVLELGCGKGEYTLGLARKYPEKNFIGIDIKGARIWRGAKTAIEEGLPNVAFLRTRIEFIRSFFAAGEVSEIWITFPDPQLKKRRNKKRLTAAGFLNTYKTFLKTDGLVHLKTDSAELYQYTQQLISFNKIENIFYTDDLYHSGLEDDILSIRTYYENMFLKEGKKITYSKFSLEAVDKILELSEDES